MLQGEYIMLDFAHVFARALNNVANVGARARNNVAHVGAHVGARTRNSDTLSTWLMYQHMALLSVCLSVCRSVSTYVVCPSPYGVCPSPGGSQLRMLLQGE
eukprot:scaffold97948_cov38-Attheya_sp.AAC.1